MKTNLLLLCALPGLSACLHAADAAPAPLAIFYSFDIAPPLALITAMQSEFARILAPAQLRVAWRPIEDGASHSESFPDLVVMRFRGACRFEPSSEEAAGSEGAAAGSPLADTEVVDGRVLPFGEVDCNELRRFIAPLALTMKPDRANAALGRAMARVGAHELYHMLTRSLFHARSGIARAEHSRSDLMAPSFTFAKPERQVLRSWVMKLLAAR